MCFTISQYNFTSLFLLLFAYFRFKFFASLHLSNFRFYFFAFFAFFRYSSQFFAFFCFKFLTSLRLVTSRLCSASLCTFPIHETESHSQGKVLQAVLARSSAPLTSTCTQPGARYPTLPPTRDRALLYDWHCSECQNCYPPYNLRLAPLWGNLFSD